jgi:hypothetical protein
LEKTENLRWKAKVLNSLALLHLPQTYAQYFYLYGVSTQEIFIQASPANTSTLQHTPKPHIIFDNEEVALL